MIDALVRELGHDVELRAGDLVNIYVTGGQVTRITTPGKDVFKSAALF